MQQTSYSGLLKEKTILALSIAVFIYILFLISSYQFKFDSVIIGVVREILDIPALLLLPFLFILSIIYFIKTGTNFRSYSFYSILILAIAAGMMIWLL